MGTCGSGGSSQKLPATCVLCGCQLTSTSLLLLPLPPAPPPVSECVMGVVCLTRYVHIIPHYSSWHQPQPSRPQFRRESTALSLPKQKSGHLFFARCVVLILLMVLGVLEHSEHDGIVRLSMCVLVLSVRPILLLLLPQTLLNSPHSFWPRCFRFLSGYGGF